MSLLISIETIFVDLRLASRSRGGECGCSRCGCGWLYRVDVSLLISIETIFVDLRLGRRSSDVE